MIISRSTPHSINQPFSPTSHVPTPTMPMPMPMPMPSNSHHHHFDTTIMQYSPILPHPPTTTPLLTRHTSMLIPAMPSATSLAIPSPPSVTHIKSVPSSTSPRSPLSPLPPCPFLAIHSYSAPIRSVLSHLHSEIEKNPYDPSLYLSLAEEYRLLGARVAHVKLLQYAATHLPHGNDRNKFKQLLEAHAPTHLLQRARPSVASSSSASTDAPPQIAHMKQRNTSYDYVWRHREEDQGLLPETIYKLDTTIPPPGRSLRAQTLHFLSMLRDEARYVYVAPQPNQPIKLAQHEHHLQQQQQPHEQLNDDNEAALDTEEDEPVAIVLPPHFNRSSTMNEPHSNSNGSIRVHAEDDDSGGGNGNGNQSGDGGPLLTPRSNPRRLAPSVAQRQRETRAELTNRRSSS